MLTARRLLVQEQGDVEMSAQGGAGVVRPDRSGARGADRITLLPSRTDATTCRARSSRVMVTVRGVGSWR